MATPRRRQRNQLPHCYYEGFLEIRSLHEQGSRRLWTCLCGDALFFFNNNKDSQYVEKMELSSFLSISDDSSPDRHLNTAGLVVYTKDDNIRLTASSLEAREQWKGYILSVKDLDVPTCLNLLPGQVHAMKVVVEEERERRRSLPTPSPTQSLSPPPSKYTAECTSPLYLSVVSEMPECYETVSRTEAELLLERNTGRGNMLLRPGRDGSSFAVTTRQELNGSVFKHYRVSRNPDGGFYIDLEKPIHCATLHEVVDYLVEKTAGALQPFVFDKPYEEKITFVQANEESGEKNLHSISPCAKPPPLPAWPKPTIEPETESEEEEENVYLNPDDEIPKNEEAPAPDLDTLPMALPPKPKPIPRRQFQQSKPLPIKPPDRRDSPVPPSFTSTPPVPERKAIIPPKPAIGLGLKQRSVDIPVGQLHDLALTELQMRLQQRRAKES
ncbi:signal-transducing adaptor protein 2b isoform X2 [Engraulis encrasicolus]|uniref:signal-transducing adaptor protein 2b isoform X2 n=1 Tax=Engraulis encrasicolus TaxID=184585 RepID=UPI002FD4B26A